MREGRASRLLGPLVTGAAVAPVIGAMLPQIQDPGELTMYIVVIYVTLLVCLVVHEAAHALVAKMGGDLTAYVGGQVSLNPIPHMKRAPIGTIVLPLILLISSGARWCMGFAHIPVDPIWAYRHPKRAALMSAAGPISNLLMALAGFLVMKALLGSGVAIVGEYDVVPSVRAPFGEQTTFNQVMYLALSYFVTLNVLLFVINLIPVPPLDGAGVLEGLFPNTAGRVIRELKRQTIVLLILVIALFYSIQPIMTPVFKVVRSWL